MSNGLTPADLDRRPKVRVPKSMKEEQEVFEMWAKMGICRERLVKIRFLVPGMHVFTDANAKGE